MRNNEKKGKAEVKKIPYSFLHAFNMKINDASGQIVL